MPADPKHRFQDYEVELKAQCSRLKVVTRDKQIVNSGRRKAKRERRKVLDRINRITRPSGILLRRAVSRHSTG